MSNDVWQSLCDELAHKLQHYHCTCIDPRYSWPPKPKDHPVTPCRRCQLLAEYDALKSLETKA
jgi:hypothetical protein